MEQFVDIKVVTAQLNVSDIEGGAPKCLFVVDNKIPLTIEVKEYRKEDDSDGFFFYVYNVSEGKVKRIYSGGTGIKDDMYYAFKNDNTDRYIELILSIVKTIVERITAFEKEGIL